MLSTFFYLTFSYTATDSSFSSPLRSTTATTTTLSANQSRLDQTLPTAVDKDEINDVRCLFVYTYIHVFELFESGALCASKCRSKVFTLILCSKISIAFYPLSAS